MVSFRISLLPPFPTLLCAPPNLRLATRARYLLFTPVGQNALRRFTADAFAHVQALDTKWFSSQSTGELSRVFARGMRGMNALLRLLVFNVGPTVGSRPHASWNCCLETLSIFETASRSPLFA